MRSRIPPYLADPMSGEVCEARSFKYLKVEAPGRDSRLPGATGATKVLDPRVHDFSHAPRALSPPPPPPRADLLPSTCSTPSGPMRFEFHDDTKRWLNTRDGKTELRAILATEMSEKCGISL